MFEQIKFSEQVYEGKTALKKNLGHMPTVTVMSRREREDNMTDLTTSIRAEMESARQKMQSLRAKIQPVHIKHACCMAP